MSKTPFELRFETLSLARTLCRDTDSPERMVEIARVLSDFIDNKRDRSVANTSENKKDEDSCESSFKPAGSRMGLPEFIRLAIWELGGSRVCSSTMPTSAYYKRSMEFAYAMQEHLYEHLADSTMDEGDGISDSEKTEFKTVLSIIAPRDQGLTTTLAFYVLHQLTQRKNVIILTPDNDDDGIHDKSHGLIERVNEFGSMLFPNDLHCGDRITSFSSIENGFLTNVYHRKWSEMGDPNDWIIKNASVVVCPQHVYVEEERLNWLYDNYIALDIDSIVMGSSTHSHTELKIPVPHMEMNMWKGDFVASVGWGCNPSLVNQDYMRNRQDRKNAAKKSK